MPQTTLPAHKEGYEEMETKTIEDLKKTRDRVEFILERHPETRGDDTLLIWRFLRLFYPNVKITFRVFKDMLQIPAFETITRSRRIIQNKNGKYLPTDKTVRKRRRREEIIREEIHEV